jgi:ATP phosphoribosyltransferase
LRTARQLLEFIVAYQRASECVSVFVNMRGDSPESIAQRMFSQPLLGGLQGPTISQVISRKDESWFAAHLVVRKSELVQAIAELRQIGGSGVVVSPVSYIFEEEPAEYRRMIAMLEE